MTKKTPSAASVKKAMAAFKAETKRRNKVEAVRRKALQVEIMREEPQDLEYVELFHRVDRIESDYRELITEMKEGIGQLVSRYDTLLKLVNEMGPKVNAIPGRVSRSRLVTVEAIAMELQRRVSKIEAWRLAK